MTREVLIDGRCAVIAEVAQAHDGSLGMAHAFIDAIAARRAPTRSSSRPTSPPPRARRRSPGGSSSASRTTTRYEYWRRMEFTEAQWTGLAQHAAERELAFLSSPFSVGGRRAARARRARRPGKSRPGRSADTPLLDRLGGPGLPVLLSTGMSSMAEIDAPRRACGQRAARIAIMQCTTAYPCPPEQVGLNLLSAFSASATSARRPVRPLRHDLPRPGGRVRSARTSRSARRRSAARCSVRTCRLGDHRRAAPARARACGSSNGCSPHPVDKDAAAGELDAAAAAVHQESSCARARRWRRG